MHPHTDPAARMIVALSGYATAGKDTAAAGLLEQGWTRVSFADKLRAALYALNPTIGVRLNGDTQPTFWCTLRYFVDDVGWDRAKNEQAEVRELLQRLGTDVGRNLLGADVWVAAAMRDLPEGNIVITDCRFPNEAQAVADRGGYVMRVNRPGVGPRNDHPSETSLDDWPFDAVLTNGGTPEALSAQVKVALGLLNDAHRRP